MKSIIEYFLASFDNANVGASARKLTAFALMICIGYIHLKYIDSTNCIHALIIDLLGVGFMLGLVTFSQLIQFKNGKDNTDKP